MNTWLCTLLAVVVSGTPGDPAHGATWRGPRFKGGMVDRTFGTGSDYRVQSDPMAVTPGTWLQVGAKLRVLTGSVRARRYG